MLKTIVATLLSPIFSLAIWSGVLPAQPIATPQVQTQELGAYNVTGGGTFRLKSSAGLADSSIQLAAFKEPVSGINYTMSYLNTTVEFATIDPQTTRSEFISFTGITQNSDGSAVLTGVTRGLTRTPAGSACTASTTLAQRHPGQAALVISDSPCHFANYAVKQNDEAITGLWNFNSLLPTTSITPTTTAQLATKGYVDGVAFSGAGVIDATASARGVVELATTLETASSTASGSSGILAIPSTNATSTYNSATAALRVPVTMNNGKLDSNFLDLTTYTDQASTTQLTATNRLYSTGTTTLTFNKVVDTSGNLPMWSLLASTSQATTGATLTISNIPVRNFLKILIFAPGANTAMKMNFNGDSGVNYSYTFATTTVPVGKGATTITIDPNGGTSSYSTTMDIFNALGLTKSYHFNTVDAQGQIWTSASATNTTQVIYSADGIWATSTAQQITQIQINGGNVIAGTQMYVYGSAF